MIIQNAGEGVEKELLFIVGRNAKWKATLEDSLVASYKTKHSYHIIQELCFLVSTQTR